MSDDRFLELENVRTSIGGRVVLDGVTLRVRRGETFVLLGRSGAGKSVTLKHLVGLMQPDAGNVRVDGNDLATLAARDLRELRRRFGYVFQSAALLNWMNVEDNLALPLREHSGMARDAIRARVADCLAMVHLTGHGTKLPGELSGGMRRRAGLARALALQPEILLYDEPTAGLDPVMAKTITELIVETREKTGTTSIVVTHSMPSAFRVADRIGLLHEGRVVAEGPPDAFRASEHPAVVEFLSGLQE